MDYSIEVKGSILDGAEPSPRLRWALKRLLDVVLAAGGLLCLWPLLAVIALAIKLDSPGPIIFRHRRVGYRGRPFGLYKFRSMVYGGDDRGYQEYLRSLIESEQGAGQGLPYRKMENDGRVTRVGRVLRRYYLDELPQLWNILKGEMSLVGPRPHVQFEVAHYTPEQQQRRLIVRPGATGLWQVAGKANCTFTELIELDLAYIDRWSLSFDLLIIVNTFLLMLRGGEGVWARMAKKIPREEKRHVEPEEEQ
jgi:lipopolysaccharide/colanic/teichoic acid biosynthesis glycosyltransferase